MNFTYNVHAQAVQDRQEALRRDAALHRLAVREPRTPLARRLRCAVARLVPAAAAPEGCGRTALSPSR